MAEFSARFRPRASLGDRRRAGVNQQLIAYYYDSTEGLYREIGRRRRSS
ncbi:hypothetical protein [Amycolatopsis thermoflava]